MHLLHCKIHHYTVHRDEILAHIKVQLTYNSPIFPDVHSKVLQRKLNLGFPLYISNHNINSQKTIM